jgi:signal peptidase I
VFQAPEQTGRDEPLIKRVIGVAGDTIELKDGQVLVNGQPIEEPYTYDNEPTEPIGSTTSWIVPTGDLFVMGDHRAVSVDSRSFGPIPVSSVVGRAWLRLLPLNKLEILSP